MIRSSAAALRTQASVYELSLTQAPCASEPLRCSQAYISVSSNTVPITHITTIILNSLAGPVLDHQGSEVDPEQVPDHPDVICKNIRICICMVHM